MLYHANFNIDIMVCFGCSLTSVPSEMTFTDLTQYIKYSLFAQRRYHEKRCCIVRIDKADKNVKFLKT